MTRSSTRRERPGLGVDNVVRELVEEAVRVVWFLVLADGVQSPGGRLDQEGLLLLVEHAGGEQDLVTVGLGVVLVGHVVDEPRSVPT